MKEAFGKKGALKKQLGVPKKEKIPVTLMQTIKRADVGETVRNPTETGKRRIPVTKLLKKRVQPVLTAREIRRK